MHINTKKTAFILSILKRKLGHICTRLRCLLWRRPKVKVVIRRFGKSNPKSRRKKSSTDEFNGQKGNSKFSVPIRIATFNVAMFSLAPAISKTEAISLSDHKEETVIKNLPKSILKSSPLHVSALNNIPHRNLSDQKKFSRSKLKVSINLPDNEISLAHTNSHNALMRSPVLFPSSMTMNCGGDQIGSRSRSIAEVLREVNADILALQDVKAEEENEMKPLSDLAAALGMKYVFAESWAPEYGNAILSKWPIKRWNVQKIADDKDFRNVLKATIEVPFAGEVNLYCTQLDHLNENWRMKQISAIIQSSDSPHILAGGLNSLDSSDYSSERWMDIVKYYEDIGKPTPKIEVMKLLKGKEYTDAKDYAGECEPVVIIAKGQNVQGTCKYGTRVDYVLASPYSGYKFIPDSYSVISSKGTSDHHIVKVDVTKESEDGREKGMNKRRQKLRQNIVKITSSCSAEGIWKIHN